MRAHTDRFHLGVRFVLLADERGPLEYTIVPASGHEYEPVDLLAGNPS